MILNLPETPLLRKTRRVAHEVQNAGGRALLVGGFVRDALLEKVPKDADIEVFGLEADVLRALLERLGRVDCVGESFRVLKLVWHFEKQRFELDISLPRRDRKIGTGHKGFEVEGDPFASVEDAARRRDFTVNAILCDPLSGEILDPFGGREDLQNRVLRAVDAAHFGEDSLRVLRAMQFAARFELQIEPKTIEICRQTPLDDLPSERIWGEWEKWLLKSPRPSLGLRAGAQIGVFERLFPPLQLAIKRRGAQIELALDGAAREIENLDFPASVALMLAVLGSFIGWRDTKIMLKSLGIFKLRGENGFVDVRNLTIQLVGERKRPSDWFQKRDQIQASDFRFLSARVDAQLVTKLARARGFESAATWFETQLRAADVWDGPPKAFLMGRDLLSMGFVPGQQLGKILERVYLAQLAGEISNVEEARVLALRLQKELSK